MSATESSERKAFKEYFDRAAAQALAQQVAQAFPQFDNKRFVRLATAGLSKLEFGDRVKLFADSLAATLPDDIPIALEILVASLPPPLPDCESITDGWLQWPLGQFIANSGSKHFEGSMAAMEALTQRFSSEYAVRPLVEAQPERTFTHLLKLTSHPSPHVRRWCSEGTRPRLPWGKKLSALVRDPTPIWPILEALKDDPEMYVRRSVANNLNDIAKDNPDLVIARCKEWQRGKSAERDWVIKHALRSLVKAGHPEAMSLVGFGAPEELEAEFKITPAVLAIGDVVRLDLRLSTTAAPPQQLAIDYVVHYVRKGGKTNEKVFKWKVATIDRTGPLELEKRHAMKLTTIRALYPGLHLVDLQVNGVRLATAQFELRD